MLHRSLLPLVLLALPALLAGCDSTNGPDRGADATHDLLFEGHPNGTPELTLFDGESGEIRRLLPGTHAENPAPSPDGTQIAFVVSDELAGTGDNFVVGRDGGAVTQLTFDDELDDQPAWSPDGARIAFRSFRTQRAGDIWVMDADGGNPVNLTPDPLPGVTDERCPAWSPDGTRIAYASNAGGDMDIWTMSAVGSDPRRLTATPEYDTEPAWSPDGATIAFRRSSDTAGSDIWTIPAGSGEAVALRFPAEQRQPVWTPDGEHIVFVNQASLTARPDLYFSRPDGAVLRPLVVGLPGGCLQPSYLKRR